MRKEKEKIMKYPVLRKKSLLSMFLVLSVLCSIALINTGRAPPAATKLVVEPATSVVNYGDTFTININIIDVSDLYGWGGKLTWHAPLLECLSVTEGPFLTDWGTRVTFPVHSFNNGDMPGSSYVLFGSTSMGGVPGVSGSGTLATVTFQVEGTGECVLDLFETSLQGIDIIAIPPVLYSIEHSSEDGYFESVENWWKANLAKKSAWPEKHHFDLSKHGQNNTLFGLVKNLGTMDVMVRATFTVRDVSGMVIALATDDYLLTVAEGETTLSAEFDASLFGPGKYYVDTQCWYDTNGDDYIDTLGSKTKTFSFAVVP